MEMTSVRLEAEGRDLRMYRREGVRGSQTGLERNEPWLPTAWQGSHCLQNLIDLLEHHEHPQHISVINTEEGQALITLM